MKFCSFLILIFSFVFLIFTFQFLTFNNNKNKQNLNLMASDEFEENNQIYMKKMGNETERY